MEGVTMLETMPAFVYGGLQLFKDPISFLWCSVLKDDGALWLMILTTSQNCSAASWNQLAYNEPNLIDCVYKHT